MLRAVKGEHGECGKGLMDSELYASWCWWTASVGALELGRWSWWAAGAGGRLVLRRWGWWVAGAGTASVETVGVGWEAAVVEFRKSFVSL